MGDRTGGLMVATNRVLASLALTTALTSSALLSSALISSAWAATITGTVTGPDGKPFMGAFVVAENPQTKMSISVLSNANGRYYLGNLPAATYTVKISSIGYASDPRSNVALTAD